MLLDNKLNCLSNVHVDDFIFNEGSCANPSHKYIFAIAVDDHLPLMSVRSIKPCLWKSLVAPPRRSE